jgi:hypothetical protein
MTHSVNYVFNLVKYFDFKLSHASYTNLNSKSNNLLDVETYIKNNNYDHTIERIFYPELVKQCSNLTGWPENFS